MDSISILDPLSDAIDRTKLILFAPFELGKWLTLGFAAWLISLSEGGVPSLSFSVPFEHGGSQAQGPGLMGPMGEFASAFTVVFVAILGIALLVGLCFGVFVLWLSSRSKFVFLHDLAVNQAHIAKPWRLFAKHGTSLFVWHLLLILAVGLITIALLVIGGALVVPSAMSKDVLPVSIVGVVLLGLVFVCMLFGTAIVNLLLNDFIVPLMYTHDVSTVTAWRSLLPLVQTYPGTFILYVVFRLLLVMVVSALLVGVLFFTCCCCCFGLFLLVPYVGSVILLPVPVFFRTYSMAFLAQFGPAYDCFTVGQKYLPSPPPGV